MTTLKWFEEKTALFFIKILLGYTLYVFLIEPLAYTYLVKEKAFNFLNDNNSSIFYLIFLAIIAITLGWVYGTVKNAIIGFLDLLALGITLYLYFLSSFRYELFPTEYSFKYLFSFCIFLTASVITNIESQIRKNRKQILQSITKLDNDPDQIRIIPDLSLDDLEKHSGISKKEIDKQTLDYFPLAEVIFEAIQKIEPRKRAFSIGINGDWGSGKSSLIALIKDIITEQATTDKTIRSYKTINFSPWIYPDENSLVKNFFQQLKEKTNSLSLQFKLETYSLLLTEVEVGGVSFNINGFFTKSHSLINAKNAIAKELEAESKACYLVFIDDLDRLDKTEILEVAKLSRILADFPNIIYLFAYDRAYIDLLLEEESEEQVREIRKGQTYFDKIIQLEFRVPQVTELKLKNYLERLLLTNENFISKSKYKAEIKGRQNHFHLPILEQIKIIHDLQLYQHFLPTIRDVNRFVNGFLLKYNSINKSHPISLCDLMLIDLLFYKYKKQAEEFYSTRKKYVAPISTIVGAKDIIKFVPAFRELPDIDRTIINDILVQLFQNRNSSETLLLIDYYFSYFGLNDFTIQDTIQFINKTQNQSEKDKLDSINYYIENEYIARLIIYYVQHTCQQFIFKNIASKNLEAYWNTYLPLFTKALQESKHIFQDEDLERLATAFAEIEIKLRVEEDDHMTRCKHLLKNFKVYYPPFDGSPKEYILLSQPNPIELVQYKEIDDHFFPKVLDLEKHYYEITFLKPHNDIQHWRLGFMFSKDNTFPLRAFRHPLEWPIFHLKRGDHGKSIYNEITLTAYDFKGNSIETEEIVSASIPHKNEITIRIIKQQSSITILGDEKQITVNYLPLAFSNKFRIFAWADGYFKFNIPISIKAIPYA